MEEKGRKRKGRKEKGGCTLTEVAKFMSVDSGAFYIENQSVAPEKTKLCNRNE